MSIIKSLKVCADPIQYPVSEPRVSIGPVPEETDIRSCSKNKGLEMDLKTNCFSWNYNLHIMTLDCMFLILIIFIIHIYIYIYLTKTRPDLKMFPV